MSDHDPKGVCSHVDEIADALARHDFPGMPSIDELHEGIQAAYRDIAETALLAVAAIGDTG